MPFDLAIFEAELALKLIPTERFPAVAQDALESGLGGPRVLRMAILDPRSGWEIDQVLPSMLEELSWRSITPSEAALRLARQRARRILDSGENPLLSLQYFYQIMSHGDYPDKLLELGYLEDDFDFFTGDQEQQRTRAVAALNDLLSP